MSGDEVRSLTERNIQHVKNLIKHCLQMYMNQNEVVDTLWCKAKIEPIFTEQVWNKLEAEDPEFFKAYHFRLLLKNQIHIFNKLLMWQLELMQKIQLPISSTSSILQRQHYSHDPASTPSWPNNNMYCNEESSGMNGINGTLTKSEATGISNFAFGAANDYSLPDMPTFPGTELLVDNESSSIEYPSQIPRNLSFSDSKEDFTQHDELLANHGQSIFLWSGMNTFFDASDRDSGDGRIYATSECPSPDILGGNG